MPGAVVRVEVNEGDEVSAGSTIVVLEAMKMEHTVRTPSDGWFTSDRSASGSGMMLFSPMDWPTSWRSTPVSEANHGAYDAR
nr:acetyl-CoA carboxylase biotin carboxyl carrier protein subunit [Mycolicibacterium porcinum]